MKEVLRTINKSDLKESPLVKYLLCIGESNEGVWSSFHMSVQFEDVVVCLQVLYPAFEFVFLFLTTVKDLLAKETEISLH